MEDAENLFFQQAHITDRLTACPGVNDVKFAWQAFQHRGICELTFENSVGFTSEAIVVLKIPHPGPGVTVVFAEVDAQGPASVWFCRPACSSKA